MNKLKVALTAILKVKNWPIYFKDYLKLIKGELIYVLQDGSKYVVRGQSNDRNIFNEIIIREFYTPKGFEIKNGDVVVDIGAHIGTFSVFASKTASMVYSFEPVLENFRLLLKNIEINKKHNITPINKAVASKTEKRELFLDNGNGGGHSFYSSIGGNKVEKIFVETVSFAEFCRKNNIQKIDFLKLDCEGGEYDILFNCPASILNIIEKISMEYHNIDKGRDVDKIEAFLESNGFAVNVLSADNILYARR